MRGVGRAEGGIRWAAVLAVLLFATGADARALEKLGVSVSGGMGGFTGGLGRSVLPGGVWSVRADAMATEALQVGFAYEGSANQLAMAPTDLQVSPLLLRHAGLMMVRLGMGARVRPWIETGIGVSHLSVTRGGGGAGPDFAGELPLATGVEVRAGLIAAGIRLGYSVMFDNQPLADGGGNMWSGGLTLGAMF